MRYCDEMPCNAYDGTELLPTGLPRSCLVRYRDWSLRSEYTSDITDIPSYGVIIALGNEVHPIPDYDGQSDERSSSEAAGTRTGR
jgi:hypothetical protein